MEGAGKGGRRPFQSWKVKKKEPMFKYPTVGLDTIVFSYGQPKDAGALIKSNKALTRYVSVNFKVGGPMATRSILSITETYLKLPEDTDNTTGNFFHSMGNRVKRNLQK